MKPRTKPTTSGVAGHSGCVSFELTHPSAQEVCIAGSFGVEQVTDGGFL